VTSPFDHNQRGSQGSWPGAAAPFGQSAGNPAAPGQSPFGPGPGSAGQGPGAQSPGAQSPAGQVPAGQNPFGQQGSTQQGATPQTPDSPFSAQHPQGGAFDQDFSFAGPPLVLLYISAGLAVVGIVLALLPWNWLAPIGWLLAGPGALLTLGRFSAVDTRNRASGLYAFKSLAGPLYWTAAGIAVVGIIVTALFTAFWIGRM
jgi:hypothetical protein